MNRCTRKRLSNSAFWKILSHFRTESKMRRSIPLWSLWVVQIPAQIRRCTWTQPLCKQNFSCRSSHRSRVDFTTSWPSASGSFTEWVWARRSESSVDHEIESYLYSTSSAEFTISNYIYRSQCTQRCVKKQYYSLCHPDSHVRAEPQSRSHGCLMYSFDWRRIISLLCLITRCCSSRRGAAKTVGVVHQRERK